MSPARPVFRHQLPVRSPLSGRALWSGIASALAASGGRRVHAAVEARLLAWFGAKAVVLTDSGTSALALALRATAGPAGRPVALPAYGCFDLATAVDAAAVPFVLYDVDPATLGPDRASLARALEAGADRIVAAHLYGVPVDLAYLRGVAADAGALVIDDAAQGAGAACGGLPLGAGGALGVLSFGRGKGMTGGGGGALLLNGDTRVDEAALAVAAGGRGSPAELVKLLGQWLLGRPALFGIPVALPFLGLGETTYRPPHPARGATALSLGVLRETMSLAEADAHVRRLHAARLRAAMRQGGMLVPDVPDGCVPGYLRCPAVVQPVVARRAQAREALRLGIRPGYPKALADLPGFGARRANPREACDGARLLAERLITLPTHAALTESDLCRLEAWCAGAS